MMAHEADFIRQKIKDFSGMTFSPEKAYLIESRLASVISRHAIPSVGELVGQLRKNANGQLMRSVVDALTINETSFFRDGRPFQILREHIVPHLVKVNQDRRSFRVWCAAASTGQEPYTIAMTLAEARTELAGWNCQITATDISPTALKKAAAGRYSNFEVSRGLPENLRSRYFERDGETWSAKPVIRTPITFGEHNLVTDSSRLGQFDVVFCRNVLIYFDLPTKRQVLDQISARLRPGGHLFLGAAETIIGITEKFRSVPGYSGLYRKADGDKA